MNDLQVIHLDKLSADVMSISRNTLVIHLRLCFPDGQEMLIIVTELTINPHASGFINKYGCAEYFKHNKDLLVYDRQQEIEDELKALNLD